MFLNTIETYRPPQDIHVIRGNLKPLSFEELISKSKSSYREENWASIAYSVVSSILRPYPDEYISRMIKSKMSKEELLSVTVGALSYKVQICNRFCCEWTREIRYFTNAGLLGGFGIFAVKLMREVDEVSLLRVIGSLIQMKFLSDGISNRALIALIKPDDSWSLVYAEVNMNIKLPSRYMKSANLNMYFFEEPDKFFDGILGGESVESVDHECTTIQIRLAY
ncbi:hypothetical protein ACWNXI_15225 [Caldibacillus thermoamylovorans]